MEEATAGAVRSYDIEDFFSPGGSEPADEEITALLRRAAQLHLERFGSPPDRATSNNVFLWAAEHAFWDVCP